MISPRILVTGAEGMIGRALPFGHKMGKGELDVAIEAQVTAAIRATSPDVVLHLAAIDSNRAEVEQTLAYNVNVLGTLHVARAAAAAGVRVAFLSTGAVFSGSNDTRHDEKAAPRPVNVYGVSKWIAEMVLSDTLPKSLIVRTGWVFGGNQAHHRKFVETAIERAQGNVPIDAACDHWGSPTFVVDLAEGLLSLIQAGAEGVVHVVNDGEAATPADMADEIVDALGSRSPIRRLPRRVLASQVAAPRAQSEALAGSTIRLRPWRIALREYVRKRELSRQV